MTAKTGLLIRWLSTSLAPVRSQSSRPIVYLPVPAKPISNTIVFSNELFSIGFYVDLHSGALRYSGGICSFEPFLSHSDLFPVPKVITYLTHLTMSFGLGPKAP